jgi:hypothetical protein
MVEVYNIFSRGFSGLDYSEDMLYEQYESECSGTKTSPRNGYTCGKRYMDATIKMWKEDFKLGTLTRFELYRDPTFPHWWLDKIFNNTYSVEFKQLGLIT